MSWSSLLSASVVRIAQGRIFTIFFDGFSAKSCEMDGDDNYRASQAAQVVKAPLSVFWLHKLPANLTASDVTRRWRKNWWHNFFATDVRKFMIKVLKWQLKADKSFRNGRSLALQVYSNVRHKTNPAAVFWLSAPAEGAVAATKSKAIILGSCQPTVVALPLKQRKWKIMKMTFESQMLVINPVPVAMNTQQHWGIMLNENECNDKAFRCRHWLHNNVHLCWANFLTQFQLTVARVRWNCGKAGCHRA